MMGEATSPTSRTSDAPELRILIIGGGVAGLSAALAIKRVANATGLNLRPIIFEADPKPKAYKQNMAQHWILWKWAYDLLLEMGLGNRLSRIATPVRETRTVDADTGELLVSYPPIEDIAAAAAAAAAGGNNAQDPESGDGKGPSAATASPMIGLRKADLVRMLLLALSGIRDDLLDGTQFLPQSADTTATGFEADLASDNAWFETEGYAELVPDLHLGYELNSCMISGSTGKITAKFQNGEVEYGDMMIGADGTHSKVRDLIGSRRFPIQHAGAAVLHGITRLQDASNPPPVTSSVDGTPITGVRPEDLLRLCPDGHAVSFQGRGISFGVNNIGNGMLGWNLVIAQPTPHFHTTSFVDEQAQKHAPVSEEVDLESPQPDSGASSIKGKEPASSYFQLEHVASDGHAEGKVGSPGPSRSGSPAPSNGSLDTIVDPVSTLMSNTSLNDIDSAPSSPGASRSGTRRNRIETAFERQLRMQRESIIAAKTAPESLETTETTHLSGPQARDLALALAARNGTLPPTVLGLIAHSDPDQVHAMDILDMADQFPETYTSPKFHPGRVILIGDAAHPVATNATGSLGGSLAISDAALLAKLIGKHLASHHSRSIIVPDHTSVNIAAGGTTTTSNATARSLPDLEERLRNLSQGFDAARVPVCNRIMTDARAEGGWGRVENNWVRSLWRLSWRYNPRAWVRATYAQMLERGGVEKGLISLNKTATVLQQ